ncbi:MAG: hypothetical protein ACRELY_20580 [Polyangiaceae bacterium]
MTASASRTARIAYAFAFAVATAACVKVTDDVKATFAPPARGEADNFAVGAPHGVAARDELQQAVVLRVDAGETSTRDVAATELAMCVDGTASSADASASPPSNCLQDAGVR